MTFFAHSLAKSRKTLALVALVFAALAPCAWADFAKTNPVTGETDSYTWKFVGTDTWDDAQYWQNSDGGNPSAVPEKTDSNVWDPILFDGDTVDINTDMSVEGWDIRMGLYNGATVTINNLVKIDNGNDLAHDMWFAVDESSQLTITKNANNKYYGRGLSLYSARTGGITWTCALAGGSATMPIKYYLSGAGTVACNAGITAANEQVIKMADVTLSGGEKSVQSKTLVSFASSTKAFTADAVIKVKDSGGTVVRQVPLSSMTSGSTTLTTDRAIGDCELVQTSTGVVLYYVDGDPAKAYTPSININFTHGGAGVNTDLDLGLAGYLAPGGAWNNIAGEIGTTSGTIKKMDASGAVAPDSEVSVAVSSTRGSWSCSSLTAATDLRHGYVDDAAGVNSTPTVTITGIPYTDYRVIVYHATDTPNTKFGYDTINGVNYTYANGSREIGSQPWGDSGVSNGANAIEEGVNTFVSGVIPNNDEKTLTIVAHRMTGSPVPRGCIAAVQVVEVDMGGKDYWVFEPWLSKSFWIAGQAGDDLEFISGKVRSGLEVSHKCINKDTREEFPVATAAEIAALPAGAYRLVATCAGSEVGEAAFDFTIQCNLNETYADHVTLTLNEVGTTPIENYTLLVRVSETLLPGFTYARAGDGTKIAFSCEDGVALSYDVDTWNAKGESLVWVKVPSAVNGTKVTFHWALKSGETASENDSTKVWTDYAGVWHMGGGEDATAKSEVGTVAANASVTDSGMFGSAVKSTANGAPLLTAKASADVNSLTNGSFTISFWTYLNGESDGTGLQYLFSRRENWDYDPGYSLRLATRTPSATAQSWGLACGRSDFRYGTWSGANAIDGLAANRWMRHDIVFYTAADGSAKNLYWYMDGELKKNMTLSATHGPFMNGTNDTAFAIGGRMGAITESLNGAMDEFRMRSGVVAAARVAVEHANETFTDYLTATSGSGGGFLVPGVVTKDGAEVDYWMTEPSISPAFWEYGDGGTIVIDNGKLRSGSAITNWCVNLVTGWETNVVTAASLAALEPGSYRVYFGSLGTATVADFGVDIVVSENVGGFDLGGTAGGRILLMNNDYSHGGSLSSPSINYQGWANVTASQPTFWQRVNTTAGANNLKASTESILWTSNKGRKLWHLSECRHGNTFPTSDSESLDGSPTRNFLPYTGNSVSISSNASRPSKTTRKNVGQLVMRNTTDAVVYSPCYTNGIGTIYFDAVNGWNDNIYTYTGIGSEINSNAYQIVVEMATNTVDWLEPTDVNCWVYEVTSNEETHVVTTNFNNVVDYYGGLDDNCWKPCGMYPIRVCGDKLTPPLNSTETLSLDIIQGGSMTNFYRVYIPLDITNSVRFRIRRMSVNNGQLVDPDQDGDVKSFILLDNIIVSPPKDTVSLGPAGWYDPAKKGKAVLGQEKSFNVPFPAVGDELYGRAVAEYNISSGISPEATNFFSSARMHYRWRYLDQVVGEWASVVLDPKNDFAAVEPLVLPHEVGDVEFRFDAVLKNRGFKYLDYSGQDLEDELAAIYSESVPVISNAANAANGYYPTRGTDWFVRLRAGASSNEVWRLFVKNADGSAYDVDGNGASYVDFEMTDAASWRAFVKTPAAITNGLLYRVEQLNPQGGDGEFTFSTNFWKGADGLADAVRSTHLAPGDTNIWSATYCPGSTGYLMFLLKEGDAAPSLSVVSADMQSFNGWNDANRNNDIVFVGTSAEDGDDQKSGVSSKMRTYRDSFAYWKPCEATNPDYWTEKFEPEGGIGDSGRWKGYTPFSSAETPNGWQAGPGMWVHQNYKSTGMALQMQGRGLGYMLFQNTAVSPRGIESISFKTRLSQDIKFSDIAYNYKAGSYDKVNYTFLAQAVMSPERLDASNRRLKEDFDGLGQISVVAYYQPYNGGQCYEFRVTRVDERKISYSLYKWTKGVSTHLGSYSPDPFSNWANTPFVMDSAGKAPVLYISVETQDDGSNRIQAGYSRGRYAFNAKPADMESGNYMSLCYWDTKSPLESGTYGVASANCPAWFAAPKTCAEPVEWKGGETKKDSIVTDYHQHTVNFNGNYEDERGALGYNEKMRWALPAGRFATPPDSTATAFGITSAAVEQPLEVLWAPDGTQDWHLLTNITVSSFTISESVTVPIYSKEDAAIQIRHGGGANDDATADVTIDDVEVRQWRGDDYDHQGIYKGFKFDNIEKGAPTNFVYTSAWVHGKGSVELSAKRAPTNAVSSIRSPLLDGLSGRGIGLGMFSFSYTNADENAEIALQVATDVDITDLAGYTKYLSDDSSHWTTRTNFCFRNMTPEEREGGSISYYLGMHGQKGAIRIVVPQSNVVASASSDDPAYGRVFITEVQCRDEPELDAGCWWGWNLRTGASLYEQDDYGLAQLCDYASSSSADGGMSGALNNSVSDDIDESDYQSYREHQPFIQTPTFTNGTQVGEFSVRARRYDQLPYVTARVSVYGANVVGEGKVDTSQDSAWSYVTHFDVTNDTYSTYSFKTKANQSFQVLRFVVVGMDEVAQKHGKSGSDPAYKDLDRVVRVALDDIVVTEALRPKMAFRNVFAFRNDPDDASTDMLKRSSVDGFGKSSMQPLAGENWGVQAEVYASQLPDEVDLSRGVSVTLYWYDDSATSGYSPWGFSHWGGTGGAREAKLAPCDDNPLVFRSTYADGFGESVLPDRPSGSVVQYMLKVEYYTADATEPISAYLAQDQWTKPAWYKGIDYNNKEFASYKDFAAYCIFDSVAPGWTWINEVNVFGGFGPGESGNLDETRQYIEVAAPVEADLTNWTIEMISNGRTNSICTFGKDVAATKKANVASNCVFFVVSSPTAKASLEQMDVDGVAVTVDGTWSFDNADYWAFEADGTLAYYYPFAARLVRPSGIVEHEIVFEGTNIFASISEELGREYSADTLADRLNAADPEGGWRPVGADSVAGDRSLGETGRSADTTSGWLNSMKRTPGFINQYQVIGSKHPTANGTTYLVYANIDGSVGHMTQTFGGETDTVDLVMAVVQKGTSTNITYNLENWYELDSVKVNGADLPLSGQRNGKVVVTLGGPTTSNNLDVVAKSRVDSSLSDKWGLTPDNRYTPAVVDWLNKGRTLRGPFEHPEGPLSAAEFHALSGVLVTNLTLTEMYWLDIDPTESNWWFKAGMIRPPIPVAVRPSYEDDCLSDGNVRMGVYLCLTNTKSGVSFAPYVLRGVNEGSLSTDYSSRTVREWDGPTFSIMGRLFNTTLSTQYGEEYFDWVGQRWFVFGPGSFNPKGSADEFQSSIEILDPYSSGAPGYMLRWDEWKGKSNVYYRWNLGDGQSVWSVETLCPTNSISE